MISKILKGRILVIITILSTSLAVIALSFSLGINLKIKEKLNQLIEQYGSNIVRIYDEDGTPYEYYEKIKNLYTEQTAFETYSVIYRSEKEAFWLEHMGVTPNYFDVRGVQIRAGRTFTENDISNLNPVIIIGSKVKDGLFPELSDEQILEKEIKIRGRQYRIIGIIEHVKEDMGLNQILNRYIFMPYSFFDTENVSMIWIRSKNESAEKLFRTLTSITGSNQIKFHYLHEEFRVISPLRSKIFIILLILSIVIFLMAEINVTNMILINISQDIRLIGIRRALGASITDIFKLYLKKGFYYTSVSGIIAFIFIPIIQILLRTFFRINLHITFDLILRVYLLTLIIGIFFSLIPAFKASKISPLAAVNFMEKLVINKTSNYSLKNILPIISVVVGTASMTIILAFTYSLNRDIEKNLSLLGGEKVIVVKSFSFNSPYIQQPPRFSKEDYYALKQALKGKKIGWITSEQIKDYTPRLNLTRINDDMWDIAGLQIEIGRKITFEEFENGENVAILGYNLYKQFGPQILQDNLYIDGIPYQVVGVLKERGNIERYNEFNFDSKILIPYTTALSNIFIEPRFVIKLDDKKELNDLEKVITTTIKQLHPDKAPPIIEKQWKSLLEYQKNFIENIRPVWLISILGLFISVIGVSNMLLARVITRKKEIGLHRALGATRLNIILNFLIESSNLLLIGFTIGILSGCLITIILLKLQNIDVFILGNWIWYMFCLNVIVTIMSVIFPIKRIIKLQPREVFTYE